MRWGVIILLMLCAACSKGRIHAVVGGPSADTGTAADLGVPDLGVPPEEDWGVDTGADLSVPDADLGVEDLGEPDFGGADGGPDLGLDLGPELDLGVDQGIDLGADMGVDAGMDAGIDLGVDAGVVLGSVSTATSANCPASAVPTSRCLSVQVTGCPGVAATTGLLKISEPAGVAVGTVVLGSDEGGALFYEVAYGAESIGRIIQPLLNQGFVVVQRTWTGAGWLNGPGGANPLACRYASMLDWVYNNVRGAGGFCVSGNGQGGSEIGYALSRYGQGAIIDYAQFTNGPTLSRIDYGCLGNADGTWSARCMQKGACPTSSCEYANPVARQVDRSYGMGENACRMSNGAQVSQWQDDSILGAGAALSFPQTLLGFVFGGMDCSVAVPLGRHYAAMVTSASAVNLVAGAGHDAPADPAAADQIASGLIAGCVLRH